MKLPFKYAKEAITSFGSLGAVCKQPFGEETGVKQEEMRVSPPKKIIFQEGSYFISCGKEY